LPLELCDAFEATVEELRAADLVLHVRDMSHPLRWEQAKVVVGALRKAGIDMESVVEVWNKSDLISAKEARHVAYIHQKSSTTPAYPISALRGDGVSELLEVIDRRLHGAGEPANVASQAGRPQVAVAAGGRCMQQVRISPDLSAADAAEVWRFLREQCSVVEGSIAVEDGGVTVLSAWMDDAARSRCTKRFGGLLGGA